MRTLAPTMGLVDVWVAIFTSPLQAVGPIPKQA